MFSHEYVSPIMAAREGGANSRQKEGNDNAATCSRRVCGQQVGA